MQTGRGGKQGFACRELQIIWCEAGHFRQAGQHARADFVAVVKGEDYIRSARPLQNPMGAGRAFDLPADAKERGFFMAVALERVGDDQNVASR